MADIFVVSLTRILDSLEKIPLHVAIKLKEWATTVRKFGLMEARKVRGYTHHTSKLGIDPSNSVLGEARPSEQPECTFAYLRIASERRNKA